MTIDKLLGKSSNQAVLLFDLDNFKTINDTLGHDYGDEALCVVADILKELESDICHTARLGGDEFLVFISDFNDAAYPERIARKILYSVKNIKSLRGKPVSFSASIGIAFLENTNEKKGTLIKKADKAMYMVKNTTKGAYRIYK